jgi:hypothetical protein
VSDRYQDRQTLADKIAWEGGNWDALEYGIRASQMPEGDTELEAAWAVLDAAFAEAEAAWERVSALLPNSEGY